MTKDLNLVDLIKLDKILDSLNIPEEIRLKQADVFIQQIIYDKRNNKKTDRPRVNNENQK